MPSHPNPKRYLFGFHLMLLKRWEVVPWDTTFIAKHRVCCNVITRRAKEVNRTVSIGSNRGIWLRKYVVAVVLFWPPGNHITIMRYVTTTLLLLLKWCCRRWHNVALVLIWCRVKRVSHITILPLRVHGLLVPLCLWYKLSRCYQCLRQNENQNSKYYVKKNNALLKKDFTLVMETDGLRPCEDAVVVMLWLVGIGWFKKEAEYPGSSSLVCLCRCYNIWKTQALYIKILISAIYIKRH